MAVALGVGLGETVGVEVGVDVGTGRAVEVGDGTGVGVGGGIGLGVAIGGGEIKSAVLDPMANTEKPGTWDLNKTAVAVSEMTLVGSRVQFPNSASFSYLNKSIWLGTSSSELSHVVAISKSTTDGR